MTAARRGQKAAFPQLRRPPSRPTPGRRQPAIVQVASGLAKRQARNQTIGSTTYCNLGSIAYPAIASIV
jgi:hypothetical protein